VSNSIKVLGASGSKSKGFGSTSFLISNKIAIDAGNLIETLGEDITQLEHVFLSHSHFDHIVDLPFIIESYFEHRTEPITFYGLPETIEAVKEHIFNWTIWPNFCEIDLHGDRDKSVYFKVIECDDSVTIDEYTFKAVASNHTVPTCGFIVTQNERSLYISGDTYVNDALVEEVNKNKSIKTLFIEVSFPSRMFKLAKDSKHLTPELLMGMLIEIERDDLVIYVYHLKPLYLREITAELQNLALQARCGKILQSGDVLEVFNPDVELVDNCYKNKDVLKAGTDHLDNLLKISIALSGEKNLDKLLEMIITQAKAFTGADGGTLYIRSDDAKHLAFKVIQTDSLNIKMGGTADAISWPPLSLYGEDGMPNRQMVAAVCAIDKKLINITDVYEAEEFNFEGTKKFDESTGYRSKSMLVIPMKNHEDELIGVLQLINKNICEETTAFTHDDEKTTMALASQAAIAINNVILIDELQKLLEAFITSIAKAIDTKSEYTGGHIRRVAKVAVMIAHAVHESTEGPYKDIFYSEDEFQQMRMAAWMHDVGKIATPEYVVDKGQKLETIFDRIHIVVERFEVLKRDAQIAMMQRKIDALEAGRVFDEEKENNELKATLWQLEEDFAAIETMNKGGEFMADDKIENLNRIATYRYEREGEMVDLLNDEEIYNLSIRKGTLTNEERDKITDHARMSLEMLSPLPFPKKYSRIVDIACNHHEKLNGKGYPRGLTADQLGLEDRIMVLADIFEALTAADRPYKDAKPMSEVFKILSFMVKDEELDPELVRFFVDAKLHEKYAEEELQPNQLDEIKLLF